MAILTERKVWRRTRRPRATVPLDYLPAVEEAHVRAALRVLKRRYGDWKGLAKAMAMPLKSLERIVSGRDRIVPAALAIRTAKLAGVAVDDVLEGRFPAPA